MSPPTTATLDQSLARKPAERLPSFYARVILSALERMTQGCLRLELPDGSRRIIGQPDARLQAAVRVVNWEFFKRCVLFGDVGFGEAYVDGDWETDDITKVISWFILNIDNAPAMSGSRGKMFLVNLLGKYNRALHLLRPNSLATSRRNIREHYDLGNDFYKLFLDPTMTYSCALFQSMCEKALDAGDHRFGVPPSGGGARASTTTLETSNGLRHATAFPAEAGTPNHGFQTHSQAHAASLEEAQTAKYDRLCRKLRLKPGEHVLEIGSGWGGFSLHAARNYGCRVTTITISEEQFKYAKQLFQTQGLADWIEIKLMDYRLVSGQFDKIASIEMLEAVGDAYLETYFAKCHELLKRDGLLGIQMITCPDSRYDALRKDVDWIQKHIFPGSLLLSLNRVNDAVNRTGGMFLHDLMDMGLCYAETLKRWRLAFNAQLDRVRHLGFDDRFIRKWNYYLCYCEAAFAMHNISVVQAVYTRPNNSTMMSGAN